MDFINFKHSVTILSKEKSEKIRNMYIDKFINTYKEQYKLHINEPLGFVDGKSCLCYLWEYLKEPDIIDFEECMDLLHNMDKVFVFWDINSKEGIFNENYWKFDRQAVLYMSSRVLAEGLKFLPEGIYVLSEEMNFSLILTHEYINDRRWCLKIGVI